MDQPREQKRQPYWAADTARTFSFELEVLVRRNFGQRYHTGLKALGHVAWLSGLAAASYYFGSTSTAILFGLFAGALLITGFSHQVTIKMRKRRGEISHPDHDGYSRDFWPKFLPSNVVKAYLEPLPFAIIAILFILVGSPYFGGYLLFCAICMVYKNQAEFFVGENKALDKVAAVMEAAAGAEVQPPLNPSPVDVPIIAAPPPSLVKKMPKSTFGKVKPAPPPIEPIIRDIQQTFNEQKRKRRRSKPPSSD